MQYVISFLEGIVTFVSPCLLPMLPIYISYFAGGREENNKRVIKNALGFILGFTVVFVLFGALAGTFGRLLKEYNTVVQLITGLIVIFFGLNFLDVYKRQTWRWTWCVSPCSRRINACCTGIARSSIVFMMVS